eukprot:SAG22_NODE_2_length_61565_cov_858.782010_32_plen_91_part_00
MLLHYLYALEKGRCFLKGKIYAYDLNGPLISFYQNIQSNHLLVYNKTLILREEYFSWASSIPAEDVLDGSVNRIPKNRVEAMQCKESYFY